MPPSKYSTWRVVTGMQRSASSFGPSLSPVTPRGRVPGRASRRLARWRYGWSSLSSRATPGQVGSRPRVGCRARRPPRRSTASRGRQRGPAGSLTAVAACPVRSGAVPVHAAPRQRNGGDDDEQRSDCQLDTGGHCRVGIAQRRRAMERELAAARHARRRALGHDPTPGPRLERLMLHPRGALEQPPGRRH